MKIYKFNFQFNYFLMLLSFLICFVGSSAYAQENKNKEEGVIVMSAAELESLLTRIAEKRKEVLKNNKALEMPVYQQRSALPYQNPNMFQDISILNYKLDLLLSQSNLVPKNGNNTTYILPSQSTGLSGQPAAPSTVINLPNQPPRIVAQPTIKVKGVNLGEGSREVLKSHQVFFANNSTMISANDKRIIQELIPIIKEKQNEILVVLKGFASKVGNAFYNNQLSYNRADAIKQILVKNGVNPSNIMILYHGADSSVSADEARRVEISLELIPAN